MGIACRPMRAGQEDAVAAMIRQLPKDLGHDVVPKITGQGLRAAADLVRVTVAEDSGLLLGCCVWMPVFSTWRDAKGVYITDLFVMSHVRGKKIGEKLIRYLCREALEIKATYIRLEVDEVNTRANAFYERLGFETKRDQFNSFLELTGVETLAGELK
jgi:ribosomal protein S18 acetylase RimI-like enzyme